MKIEQLLEEIVECIKNVRRWGTHRAPKFPTIWDLSKIRWDNESQRIELDLLVDGKVEKYDMWLYKVENHGELQLVEEESDDGSGA